jgi:23S rRNA (guanine745-N1)-methyltransferase
MNFSSSDLLRCPLDQLPLQSYEGCLRCDSGHSYDIARLGYVNLLSASDKRSKDPGDSKEMVAARGSFLSTGHYEPIADRLAELLTPLIRADSTIVDAGCGEGYYLQQLQAMLSSSNGFTPAMIGLDISKWAVQAATRRLAATWLVASNRNIPVAAHSVDCLLSLFGFPMYDSFQQVLKKGGALLVLSAGPRHLIELREVIYPEVKSSESSVVQQAHNAGFTAGETSTLEFTTGALNPLEINHLLSMTPHFYRAGQEGIKRAALLDKFPVTVDVVFQLLHSQVWPRASQ